MFSTTLLPACKFLTTLRILGYCAHRCAQVRTGAHKCAHTLFGHKFNWETTWKHVFHHFATCLQVFDNFEDFGILCAQVRTGAHRCAQVRTSAHTHFLDINSTWKQLGNMFSTTLLPACKFLTTLIILGYCAHMCAQVRTGAHKCAHTLFGHKFNWETTWKHVFHHFATCLQVFDNFEDFGILCAQVRTGAHRCAQVRTHTFWT